MIIINEHITEEEVIKLDSSFFFGLGVFETILINNSQPIMLKAHLDRLNQGLKLLNIDKYIDEKYTLLQINKLTGENYALKITVSDKNILFSKREIGYKAEDYERGFSLKVSKVRRNPSSPSTYIKSTNYLDNLLEKQRAKDEGFHEVLFLNGIDYITEGSMSNLFFIKDHKLHTPSIECGLLAGVLRSWIIDRYEVIQGQYTLDEIRKSDGIFLTNSLMGIMKVSDIEGIQVKTCPNIKKFQTDYRHFLEVNKK
ncbi:MAG: 4-amino-4-deoxychorismate lyase [Firmicutes bacterium HGW-Firmicutes-7]|nr:MAG: 4-amino-4-deoxychorismate lyase [Firmicutes bacterium HGW-Firmicutes-7]